MRIDTNSKQINSNKSVGAKVVYPKLSYEIVGILFEVHNELGNRYQEKYYQRAVEIKLGILVNFYNESLEYKRILNSAAADPFE